MTESNPVSPMLPNFVGHHWFRAVEVFTGRNGLIAVIHLSGLSHYANEYPPADNSREFPIAHLTALNLGFLQMAGRIGGGGMAKRGGMSWVTEVVRHNAVKLPRDLDTPTFDLVNAILKPLTLFSDVPIIKLSNREHTIVCTLGVCPACWGISSETIPLRSGQADPAPICHFIVGVLSEGIRIACGRREFQVVEIICHAQGTDHCTFEIGQHPLSLSE